MWVSVKLESISFLFLIVVFLDSEEDRCVVPVVQHDWIWLAIITGWWDLIFSCLNVMHYLVSRTYENEFKTRSKEVQVASEKTHLFTELQRSYWDLSILRWFRHSTLSRGEQTPPLWWSLDHSINRRLIILLSFFYPQCPLKIFSSSLLFFQLTTHQLTIPLIKLVYNAD